MSERETRRWSVQASRRTPWWFYACETYFIDAADEAEAATAVECRPSEIESFDVLSVVPATPEMEAAHRERVARRELWLSRVRAGENPRGLL